MSEIDNPVTPTQPTEPQTPPVVNPEPSKPQGVSPDEVQRVAAKEKSEGEKAGRRAALAELAEQAGMSVEDLLATAKAKKDEEEAKKDEVQRLTEANANLAKDAETKVGQSREAEHRANVKLQLLLAGVPLPEDAEKKVGALDRLTDLVKVATGASPEDIAANINLLKEELPQLFAPATSESNEPAVSRNPPSNPSGVPQKPSIGGVDVAEYAKQVAAERNAKRGV